MSAEPNRFATAIDQLLNNNNNEIKAGGVCFGLHCISEQPTPLRLHHCAASCKCSPEDDASTCLNKLMIAHGGHVELVAVDSAAADTFLMERHGELLTDLEESNSAAIGVGSVVQHAQAKGRFIARLRNPQTGKIYQLHLGKGHILKDLPVSILSVSKLIPKGFSNSKQTTIIVFFRQENTYGCLRRTASISYHL